MTWQLWIVLFSSPSLWMCIEITCLLGIKKGAQKGEVDFLVSKVKAISLKYRRAERGVSSWFHYIVSLDQVWKACVLAVYSPTVTSLVSSRNAIVPSKHKRLSVIDRKILSAAGSVRGPFSARMLTAFRHKQKASLCQ